MLGKIQEKYERLAKEILSELEKRPQRRTRLLIHVIQICGSPARFDSVFRSLKQAKRIRKVGPRHTDPYKITWVGRQYLAGLIAKEGNQR